MASTYTMVAYGSQGSAVRQLQNELNKRGYSLDQDGIFGKKTRAAVRDYQKKNGLTMVDGIAGDETWGSLLSAPTAAEQAAQAAGAPLFVLDGAVIVGTAAQAECDRLCVVTAPFETSVARIVARDGISPEMAARRLNAQTPEQTLTAQADYTLHNDAGLEALQAAAARLCERLQAEGGVTAAL